MIFGYNAPNSYGFGSGQGFGFVLAGSVPAWAALGLINFTNESSEFEYTLEPEGADLVDTANTATTWTPSGTNTVTQNGDEVVITYVDDATGATLDLTALGGLSEDLVSGERYEISFEAKVQTSLAQILVNGSALPQNLSSTTFTTITHYFDGTGTDTLSFNFLHASLVLTIKNIAVVALNGENKITNQGSGLTTYDGLNYSGESLEYGATQLIDIPLDYTLGTDLVTNGTFTTDTDWTKDTGWTISGGTANAAGKNINISQDIGVVTDSIYYLTYDVLNYVSGIVSVKIIGGGANTTVDANGSYSATVASLTSTGNLQFSSIIITGDFSIDNVTAKKVTFQTACVALYNTINSEWEYITSFTDIVHSITEGTYGHVVVLASEPSAADKTYLEANIHAFSDLYFDRATELTSIVKADIQHLYIPNVLQGGTLIDIAGTTDITIPNYAATIYTNVDQNPQGQQTTNITFDGTGLATGVTYDTMDWGGNHYMDLGFMPPSDSAWEMDMTIYVDTTEGVRMHGVYASLAANRLYFLCNTVNAQIVVGDKTSSHTVSTGWVHVRIEFDGSGNGNVVINDTTTYAYTTSSYAYSATESFFLGQGSRAGAAYNFEATQPSGYFQYTEGTRTAAERTAAYDAAKLQHPTLP